MRKSLETDMEFLLEAVSNYLYGKEPLANALLVHLSNKGLINAHEVMDRFDSEIKRIILTAIEVEKQEQKDSEVQL